MVSNYHAANLIHLDFLIEINYQLFSEQIYFDIEKLHFSTERFKK